jgi:type IV pilus assembly protein PilA
MKSMMKKAQQGFTLIELMIVVAIIGILASIAIPAYQDYMTRSKWSKAVAEIGAIKLAISECMNDNSGNPTPCDSAGGTTDELAKYGISTLPTANSDRAAITLMAASGTTLGSSTGIIITGSAPLANCVFTFTAATQSSGLITWTPVGAAGSTPIADAAKCKTFVKGAT